jgi:hypothetical protein
MFSCSVTALAQFKRSAEQAFVRIVGYHLQSAAGAVELYLDLIALFDGPLSLFLLQLLDNGVRESRSAHRTADVGFFLNPMPRPYLQALKMKVVTTLNFAVCETHLGCH